MKKRWIIYPIREALRDQISQSFEISRVSAQILINRGLDNVDVVQKFLNLNLNNLYDPFILEGITQAVERILLAVKRKETVLIHGDYDVDGITSTAIMYVILRSVGVPVYYYIPNRLVEGYGLGEEGIQAALNHGASLVITVDCGINAVNEVNRLKANGIDVIITDHHVSSGDLPDAWSVVNPNLPERNYPFKELAGVGVCFKLLHALLKKARQDKLTLFDHVDLREHLDLVALGTIADMMPLVDENRVFVLYGLRQLSNTSKIGLQKLKEKTAIPQNRPMKTTDVSFFIAPRINAIGRLKEADLAVELMITDDPAEAQYLTDMMEKVNRERQKLEEEVFLQAKDMIENTPEIRDRKILLVAKRDWAVGIVSIVAARLTREYFKPAIVFTIGDDNIARGSARSVTCFNLLDGLSKCDELLLEYGGHSFAAGLSLKAENIDALTKRINAIADAELINNELLPEVYIDYTINLADIGDQLMKETEMLAPFGQKNSRPVFLSENLMVQGIPRFFGRNHVKFIVEDDGIIQEVIGFNMQEDLRDLSKGDIVDIVYSLHLTEYTGIPTIQLQILDARIHKN
ncbi:MAG: single-stranded-DNA-specific exonuclease RecJ [Candidatus Auribacterota bacterium]